MRDINEYWPHLVCRDLSIINSFYEQGQLFNCNLDKLESRLDVSFKNIKITYVLSNQVLCQNIIPFSLLYIDDFHVIARWASKYQCLNRPIVETGHAKNNWHFSFGFKDILGYSFDVFYYVNNLEYQ
ncbi:MAG: hypothetical protein ACON5A_04475 [Candidatus Comchoanobacterales bacterium]